MDSLTKISEQKEKFLKTLGVTGPADSSNWLNAEGALALQSLDFPNRKTEAWKYTRTAKISKLDLSFAEAASSLEVENIEGLDADRMVFSNGNFVAEESSLGELPQGVILGNLKEIAQKYPELIEEYLGKAVKTDADIFTALNATAYQDGLVLFVPKKTALDRPVEVIQHCKGNNTLQQTRNLVIVQEGGCAEVLIRTIAEETDNYVLNAVSEFFVQDNAELTVNQLQFENKGIYQVNTEEAHQAKDSRFRIRTFTHNSDWVRNDLKIRLNGSNTDTHLSGAYLLKGREHVDNHTTVDHKVPHCISNELYKGLIDEKATGVFNGKVFVREDAQKTEAYQSNSNIVLTDDATINSKPELEIYADDVKCSHGSTTGQFDEDAVFYLQARGLSEESAYRLLTTAFIGEVVEQVENTALRNSIVRSMNLGEVFLDEN
jgi:Fe-S cluster assembly protein SufD